MSGLLQRASLLSANKGLAFNSFIQNNKFTLLGIFTQYNTFYYISESIGFNGKSILKSFSTLDFWDGTIPEENKIYRFSLDDNNIYPFLQFFSEEVQEILSSLNIIKKDDKVYILGNEDFSENTVKELTKLTESQSNLSNQIFDTNSIKIDTITNSESSNHHLHSIHYFYKVKLASLSNSSLTMVEDNIDKAFIKSF